MSKCLAIKIPSYDFSSRYQTGKLLPVCSNFCMDILVPHYEEIDSIEFVEVDIKEFPPNCKCIQCDKEIVDDELNSRFVTDEHVLNDILNEISFKNTVGFQVAI